MKKCISILTLFVTISIAAQTSKSSPIFESTSLPEKRPVDAASEDETRKFAQDYIAHINRKNWIDGIEQYLPGNNEAFLKEHTAFRTSLPNYEANIKRMFVEGDEIVLWLNVTGNYVENYTYKTSNYGDQMLLDFEAKNQAVSWDETWYFNVVDGKFGGKWDMLKDNYKILQDLNVE